MKKLICKLFGHKPKQNNIGFGLDGYMSWTLDCQRCNKLLDASWMWYRS